ncbi:hypothetical protein [Vibrio parahaemolyticus]|uniref:hypothetical protein n=1 Tax=Vibrio parahaemolyticus TaxID=670 RepID=UPI000D530ABA|nr:hypothetical protein [Vibrio parahaemolyticus]AWG77743.1 hypothetical protein C9I78_02410 [Vibrio parahaemolyticus]AWJ77371.1 hypothetical protein C7Y67_02530 [Vibrio parahaemolyticus]
MKMIFEMSYRRTGKFIYTRDEICAIYKTNNLEQILSKSPYLANINFERFVFLRSRLHEGFFEQLALSMRKDHLCYISFEDALSRWNVISQLPMMLIIATTGESGIYSTQFGRIEFVHVEHTDKQIVENTVDAGYSLRLAKKWWAFEDLKCLDRNMDLIDYVELYSED